MFNWTIEMFDFVLDILQIIWDNPLFLGFCGFFILCFVLKIFHELVGFNKC